MYGCNNMGVPVLGLVLCIRGEVDAKVGLAWDADAVSESWGLVAEEAPAGERRENKTERISGHRRAHLKAAYRGFESRCNTATMTAASLDVEDQVD